MLRNIVAKKGEFERFLVTGCAGFIGAKVTEMLLAEGHFVAGIDNLNDAYDPRLKHWRLDRLRQTPHFRFRQLDICDRPALNEFFESEVSLANADETRQKPFSAVINLAARAGVQPSVDNPWVYCQSNSEGTLNLLDLCRKHCVNKFVLASTSSLYGKHNPIPFREDADTDRPLSPYAASKKAAEAMAYVYHHLYGIDVSILRYFTVYGPAGRPDMSIFRFIRRMAEGQPITVYGDGTASRDFTYVDDIARGTIAALKPLGYEIINLGGERCTTILALIDRIAELLKVKPLIDHKPTHAADVPTTRADIGKARRLLQWEPQIVLEEGVSRAVSWYMENRQFARDLRQNG
jgi:UDP-glucuronate 4-epimerase